MSNMNTELDNLIFLGDCQNALSEDPVARDQGDKTMPIAVVGLSCRYPGVAKNPESLWQACAEERNLWQPIPKDKVNPNAFYHPNPSRNGTVRFWCKILKLALRTYSYSQILEAVTFLTNTQAFSMHPSLT